MKRSNRWRLLIHGGAGSARPEDLKPERERAVRAALSAVLETGAAALAAGGSALDAVEEAVRALEDSPLFNAGKGAVLNAAGKHELEAAIMDGATLQAGAVANVRRVKNPVALARLVMERSPHVYLAGEGAEAFAAAASVPRVAARYFLTEARLRDLEEMRRSAESYGTVGAVALDRDGDLAAATSTGGMAHKLPGRIGDSSLIGAGTYARNASCAVSCTGHGEFFIRAGAARDLCALVEYGGRDVRAAARTVIRQRVGRLGGRGGVIALDRRGRAACVFNTDIMYRGAVAHDATMRTAIRPRERL